MPREKDVIYCVLVDENGNIQSTSMLFKHNAEHALANLSETLKRNEVS